MEKKKKILQLQIRVSPREKAAITRRAHKASMGISEWVLSKVLPAPQLVFQRLLKQLEETSAPKYVLAEIHDLLSTASSDEFEMMVAQPPQVSHSSYLANYVAAMVEYAASQKGNLTPSWTRDVPGLSEPVFGSDLESLRLYLLTHSPPPFRCRNIFIDSTIGQRV